MASKELILDIIARDRASAEFAKVAKASDSTGGAFDTLGKKVAAAVSVGAIIAFGVESVKAFASAEKSQAALQLAMSKFPNLADTSFQALHSLNQEMQDKAAIDADSLDEADAVLARFELTGTEIKKLTPLLVDYATVSGKTAPEAAETLGKALLGNARALKALGIEFKPTGDRAADLATIMDKLQEKVGGAGEAFAQTAAGKLKSFDLAVEDIKEAVGEALVPALTAATDAMKGIADQVPAVISAFSQMQSVTAPLASALGSLPELPSWLSGEQGFDPGVNWWSMWAPGGIAAMAIGNGITAMGDMEEAYRGLGMVWDEERGAWIGTAETANKMADAFHKGAGMADLASRALANWDTGMTTSDYVIRQLQGGIVDTTKSLEVMQRQMDTMAKNRSLIDATSDLYAKIDELRAGLDGGLSPALNKTRTGFDLTRESGRQAAEKMNDVAESAEDAAVAAADEGRWKQAKDLIDTARDSLIKQATQWGLTKEQAQKYVDRILTVPKRVETMIQVNSNIEDVRAIWNSLTSKWVTLHVALDQAFAGGGVVRGVGGPRSDKVPIMASPGEFVVQQSAAARLGYENLLALNATGRWPVLRRVGAPASSSASMTTAVQDRPGPPSVVELHIDGRKLVETLIRYRREHGDQPLGLG